MSLFMANYGRELRMEIDIRKKGKVEKMIKFVKRMKKIQEETGVTLKKSSGRNEAISKQKEKES